MIKDSLNQEPSQEVEALAFDLQNQVRDMGLERKIRIGTRLTRTGEMQIVFEGNKTLLMGKSNGLEPIKNGQSSKLIDALAKSLGSSGKDVTTPDLLRDVAFQEACIDSAYFSRVQHGNVFLLNPFNTNEILPSNVVPVFYGSTAGFNFAELAETVVCARKFKERGFTPRVIFDTTMFDEEKATPIFNKSIEVTESLPEKEKLEFVDFLQLLGQTAFTQRIGAALSLVQNQLAAEDIELQIPPAEAVLKALGSDFTLGKLLVIGKLAGQNPRLFRYNTLNNLLEMADVKNVTLTKQVGEMVSPQGFTWYARDAVIASDFPGVVGIPFKLTTHANIYKVLKDYGSLYSEDAGNGAVLCPITKHRIQTREQAQTGSGDPCDVTVLAFLAQKQPENFARLMEDFNKSCKVLTPGQAIAKGTGDKRFIVEDYFEL